MLNLWIGLCRGDKGLPTGLSDLGYREHLIEEEFYVIEVDGRVRPEMIACSSELEHTLLLEWKSGANTEADQLERYAGVSDDDLRERAHVPVVATESHNVTVVGKKEHEERLRIGIEDEFEFPLIVADDDGLEMLLNEFEHDELTDLFNPLLAVKWDRVPMHYVPIDGLSKGWEVAEVVMPVVVEAMNNRDPRVGVRETGSRVCERTWDHMGQEGREVIRSKIRDVFAEAAANQFEEYLEWHPSGFGYLRITHNPLDLEPTQQTRSLQKMQRLTEEFIDTLRRDGLQTTLDFDE